MRIQLCMAIMALAAIGLLSCVHDVGPANPELDPLRKTYNEKILAYNSHNPQNILKLFTPDGETYGLESGKRLRYSIDEYSKALPSIVQHWQKNEIRFTKIDIKEANFDGDKATADVVLYIMVGNKKKAYKEYNELVKVDGKWKFRVNTWR